MVLNEWDVEKMRRLDREEGREEGRDMAVLSDLRSLMKKLGRSAEEAMDLLSIPALERERFTKLLSEE